MASHRDWLRICGHCTHCGSTNRKQAEAWASWLAAERRSGYSWHRNVPQTNRMGDEDA